MKKKKSPGTLLHELKGVFVMNSTQSGSEKNVEVCALEKLMNEIRSYVA
jgi:hypothetical protein